MPTTGEELQNVEVTDVQDVKQGHFKYLGFILTKYETQKRRLTKDYNKKGRALENLIPHSRIDVLQNIPMNDIQSHGTQYNDVRSRKLDHKQKT